VTAARHASDAREEILRLRIALEAMCERSLLGVAPTGAELNTALLGASAAEYHVCRTMVAIECSARRGSDRDPPAGAEQARRPAFSTEGAR